MISTQNVRHFIQQKQGAVLSGLTLFENSIIDLQLAD